jgi:archaellum biogenesis ATPase FlaH
MTDTMTNNNAVEKPDDDWLEYVMAEQEAIINAPRTSWDIEPIDNILDGDTTEPPPVYLMRSDGVAMLYKGKVSVIHGEPESCKGWLACMAAQHCLESSSEHVLYIDFEDTAKGVVPRMMALETDLEVLRSRFHYIGPTEMLYDQKPYEIDGVWHNTRSTIKSLQRALTQIDGAVGIVVLDGMNQAIANQGGKTGSSEDVSDFYRDLPRMLTKREGCAVLIVDHLPKAAGNAAVDGAEFLAKVTKPFGRGGVSAVVEISITKDRPGWLRQYGTKPPDLVQRIADFHLTSYEKQDTITLELLKPDTSIGYKLAQLYNVKIQLYNAMLESAVGLNTKQVREAGRGHGVTATTAALEAMLDDGNITITGKSPKIHKAVVDNPPVPKVIDLC